MIRPALAAPCAPLERHAEVEPHDGRDTYCEQRQCSSKPGVPSGQRDDDCDRDDPDEEREGVSLALEWIPGGLLVAQMM